jgi:hypothetical protein
MKGGQPGPKVSLSQPYTGLAQFEKKAFRVDKKYKNMYFIILKENIQHNMG